MFSVEISLFPFKLPFFICTVCFIFATPSFTIPLFVMFSLSHSIFISLCLFFQWPRSRLGRPFLNLFISLVAAEHILSSTWGYGGDGGNIITITHVGAHCAPPPASAPAAYCLPVPPSLAAATVATTCVRHRNSTPLVCLAPAKPV